MPDRREDEGSELPHGVLVVPVYRLKDETAEPEIAAFPDAPQGPTILAWSTVGGLVGEFGEDQLWVGIHAETLKDLAERNGFALEVDQSVGGTNR